MPRENLGDHGLSSEEWEEKISEEQTPGEVKELEENPVTVEKVISDIRDILMIAREGRKTSMLARKLIVSITAIRNFESGKTMLPDKCWERIESAYNLSPESAEKVRNFLEDLVRLREEEKLAKEREMVDKKEKEKNTKQEKKDAEKERMEKIKSGELPPDPLFRKTGQQREPGTGERNYEGYKPD